MALEDSSVQQASLNVATGVVLCPACANPASAREPLPGWGEWCLCGGCELEFANPMELPEKPEEMFGNAYMGQRLECGMEEFAYRMSIRSALLRDPQLWFFSPFAIHEILNWLTRRVRPGATVLDVGCGLGFFLHTLRRQGYDAVGVDVAEPAVLLNRGEGFRVWHGTLDTMPEDFVRPDAIVSLFMIHHLVDPLGFFKMTFSRWPEAPVAIAEYGRDTLNPLRAAAFPPRTLTRWNAKSLQEILSQVGYHGRGVNVRSTGSEHPMILPLRAAFRKTIGMPRVYSFGKTLQRRLLPKVMKPFQQPAYTVLGFGEPRSRS